MKIIRYALIALIAFAPSAVLAKAKITVKPDSDHPKGKIAIKGSGFDINESIGVYWDDKKLLFTVNSDGSGMRSTPFALEAEQSHSVIPHLTGSVITGSVITGESRYPSTRITIVAERKDAVPALKWVPAFVGTT